MVKALLWKEWRRLRALRWTLMGIALALPAFFALGAKAAEKGWGLHAFAGYSVRAVLLEAVPMALGLGVWPLAAMVLAVQAFTADRADGTEAFLLDRPISRRWLWTSRLTGSLASLAVVVLLGLGMVLVFFGTYGGGAPSIRGLLLSVVASVLLMVTAVLAALGATALVAAPLAAFLIALLLAATPILAGSAGTLLFPYATWHEIPLAGLAACGLGLAMPLASWFSETRGEPAGRGRRMRSVLVLGGGLFLAGLGFVVAAPIAVRAGAPRSRFSVIAPPDGRMTLVLGERGYGVPGRQRTVRGKGRAPTDPANGPAGFLVDLSTGTRRAFLPPELQWARWNGSGTKLVVMDNSRPLGSIGASRLRFLDAEGRPLGPSVPEPDGLAVQQALWAGDQLVVLYGGLETPTTRVDLLDPETGLERTVLEIGRPSWATLHDPHDGRIFLFTVESDVAPTGPATRVDGESATWSLRPLDPGRAELGAPVLQGNGFTHGGLSPSGRYWMQRSKGRSAVIEVSSGTVHALSVNPKWLAWTADDALVWLETYDSAWILFHMTPGGVAQEWARGSEGNAQLKISPDGAYAVVAVLGRVASEKPWVLLLETGSDRQGRELRDLAPSHIDTLEWAGPHTLAAGSWRRLDLYDVTTNKRTVVFGRP